MSGRFRPLSWPARRRVGLLSLSSAAILVVLMVTAIAALLGPSSPTGGGGLPGGRYAVGSGVQPAVNSPTPSAPDHTWATPDGPHTPSHLLPSQQPKQSPAEPLTATYRTASLLGLGGFDTIVTVLNPGANQSATWTVVLTMPSNDTVENRSPELVTMEHTGSTVTLHPVAALNSGDQVTFTVRLKTLLALDAGKTRCAIDGNPCERT